MFMQVDLPEPLGPITRDELAALDAQVDARAARAPPPRRGRRFSSRRRTLERLLRPGMTATAEIEVKRIADALLVPNAALRFAPPESLAKGRGLIGSLFARRPPSAPKVPGRDERAREQRIHRLRGGELEPIDVVIGATDGAFTEIVSGELGAEDALVVNAKAQQP